MTADVGAAQKTLGRSRRQLARTEREALEQARPGALPGKLTPAQTTRANRLASQARDAKAAALKDFADATRNAKEATNPNVAARFRKRASSARGRARQAQARMDHWNQVAGRETRPTRRVLTPSASGDVFYHASREGLQRGGRETVSHEVHLGSRKAAEDRAKVFKGAPHKIEAYRLPDDAKLPRRGERGSRENPFTEEELGTLPGAIARAKGQKHDPWHAQKVLRDLRDKGYDAVFYRNEIEDKGALSALALDRRRLTSAEAGLESTARTAPMRVTVPTARKQLTEAETGLATTKAEAKAQRSARRVAEREAAAQKVAPKGYVPRVPASRVERVGTGATLEDLLGKTTVRGRVGSKKPSGPQTKKR